MFAVHPFEIMAEPIRRRIVEILASGEHNAGEIQAVVMFEFGVGRSAVDHHLARLKLWGWVFIREEWPNRYYQLEPSVVSSLESATRRLRRLWNKRIGTVGGLVPYPPNIRSRKGRRGHGVDPDSWWWGAD